MNYYEPRNIEMYIHKKQVEDLIASHLYAISVLNDNEEVDISFNPEHIKDKRDHLPLKLRITRPDKEVESNRINGKGEKL